jgi:6-phosphofructokinase 1
MERLAELLSSDRKRHPSKYAVLLISEGAQLSSDGGMSFEGEEADQFGHRKLGGIGDQIAARLKELSPKYNDGRRVNVINQRLGYLVRCGQPDAIDSIVPMAYGNLALDLILSGASGRLVCLRDGCYDNVPIEHIMGRKKSVNVEKYYNPDRLRPKYDTLERHPLFIMTGEG